MLWELRTEEVLISLAFVACMSFIAGWIADRLLGWAGFGVIGNWLLLLGGTYTAVYAFNMAGWRMEMDPALTIVVAAIGATTMLMVLTGFKTLFQL